MRPVSIGQPLNNDDFKRWVEEALLEIERSSEEETEAIADDFDITNITETRTLDGSTATLADVVNVVGTFLIDLKNRGQRNI